MSTAGLYFSPHFYDSLDPSESVKLSPVFYEFTPRERPCGACRRPFTTTPRRAYFCPECWHTVRRDERDY